MYFPTLSASGFVLARTSLWTLKMEDARPVHGALGHQEMEVGMSFSSMLFLLLGFFVREGLEEIQRQWENDRGVLFGGDFGQGAQEAELKGLGILGNDVGGLGELAGGLEFALGVDDLGPPFPFGLGLLGDGPDHVLRQVDLFHLDELDLDAPGVGVLFDDLLEAGVELVPLREKVVERHLAEETPQGRLGQLGGGVDIILDIDHALKRVYDPEVKDGVDLHRDVVLGDDVLGRDVHRDEPQADFHDAVDRGEDEDEARPLGLGQEAAETEDDPPLVLSQDLDRVQDIKNDEPDDDDRISDHDFSPCVGNESPLLTMSILYRRPCGNVNSPGNRRLSQDTRCGQSRTADCRSRDSARPPP